MKTEHKAYYGSSSDMGAVQSESVDLVVTSPPYPMVEMWDESFGILAPEVTGALADGNGALAFELMHRQMDQVWTECYRVVRPSGFLCINIGDATRKVLDNFRLYSNHSRIISFCESLGFQSLPLILWRKQTNAPNKFMGSGMLPSGAYVTLEHEYILILRKGPKRVFGKEEAQRRRSSALFWEERNTWFSDIWDFKGVRQVLSAKGARDRSAAYPLELAHRLINMYSLQGDIVLDPFLGTGTTTAASILNGRNSIGFEIVDSLSPLVRETIHSISTEANNLIARRLDAHLSFVGEQEDRRGKPLSHVNEIYGFRVMTGQEKELRLPTLDRVEAIGESEFIAHHSFDTLGIEAKPTSVDSQLAVEDMQQLPLFGQGNVESEN